MEASESDALEGEGEDADWAECVFTSSSSPSGEIPVGNSTSGLGNDGTESDCCAGCSSPSELSVLSKAGRDSWVSVLGNVTESGGSAKTKGLWNSSCLHTFKHWIHRLVRYS